MSHGNRTFFVLALSLIAIFFLAPRRAQAQLSTFFIPQVVDGGGYKTLFTATNLSASTIATFSIQVIADIGNPAILNVPGQTGGQSSANLTIQPGGQVTLSTIGAASLTVGWAMVSSGSSVGVSAVFLVTGAGGNVQSAAGILPQPSQTSFTLIGLIKAAANTGVAILNPSSSSPANATFKAFDANGVQASTTKSITIGPQSKIAQFFYEGSLFTDLTDLDGTVVVSSDIPIQVLTLRQEKVSAALSTLPNLPGRTGNPVQHADATFSWIDATPTGGGSRMNFAGDVVTGDVNGQVSSSLGFPFPFVFYGRAYGASFAEMISVAEDGWLSFIFSPATTPKPLPNANDPAALVAALFFDMHFNVNTPSQGVFTKLVGTSPNRQFVIEWKDVNFVDASQGTATFEIILYEGTGDIKIQYLNAGNNVPALVSSGLVIGIQDDTRTLALPVNLSVNPPHANKVYTFQYNGGTSYTLVQN